MNGSHQFEIDAESTPESLRSAWFHRRGFRWTAVTLLGTACVILLYTVTRVPASAERQVGRFLLFSDVHMDLYWGPRVKQGRPCYCHNDMMNLKHGCADHAARDLPWKFACDTPYALGESAVRSAKAFLPNPDFVLNAGDMSRHHTRFLEDPAAEVFRHVVNVTDLFDKYFPGTANLHHPPPVHSLGNNDIESNYNVNISKGCNQAFLAKVAHHWSRSLQLSEESIRTMSCGGYYSYAVSSLIIVLVLDTMLYAKRNVASGQDDDPLGQFEWLRSQLKESRETKRKAYILGHLAPGRDLWSHQELWHSMYVDKYLSVIQEFRDVVYAQIYGHEHRSYFKNLPESISSSGPLLFAGAICPLSGNLPTFHIVKYDKSTAELLELEIYSSSLVGEHPSLDASWALVGSFAREYSLPDLSAKAFRQFLRRLNANVTLFEQWFKERIQGTHCDVMLNQTCRRSMLCMLGNVRPHDYQNCMSDIRLKQSEAVP